METDFHRGNDSRIRSFASKPTKQSHTVKTVTQLCRNPLEFAAHVKPTGHAAKETSISTIISMRAIRASGESYVNLEKCWAGFLMDSEEHLIHETATKDVYQPMGFRRGALWMFKVVEVADAQS